MGTYHKRMRKILGGWEMENRNLRLKELRKESKLTKVQLAKYLGVAQSMLIELEDGNRSLSVSLIEKLCNLFGCTEAYLLGEDDSYIPLNFAFRSNGIQTEDLEGIAAVNKIAMNLRYMNEMMGEKKQ